ncbi:hypothetical protein CLIB1444_06S06084 [[Candida] jaroonii]|uniref:Uncharacterized protein n=1 Tax=[Candida] jaroonii TaxID=467808 RepID=A0ACA9Y993_9ASCO|nr:hypothetical protein CLIB1444_06S06084 [[Candida] jaroonii]
MFDNQNVDNEISKMESEIKLGLDKLNTQRNMLFSQRDTYQTLRSQISKNIQDEVMIMIGDGYFVNMAKEEAHEFLERRIRNIDVIIKDFTARLDGSRELIKQFNINDSSSNQSKEERNEEGMPFMDIVEELDDDDNILSVKLNKKDFKIQEQKAEKKKETPLPPKNKSQKKDPVKEEFVDIVEELDENDNVINVTSNGKSMEGFKKPNSSEEVHRNDSFRNDKSSPPEENESNQFEELLEDMEIEHKTTIVNKIDSLSINDEDKAALKEIAQDLHSRGGAAKEKIQEMEDKDDEDDEYIEEPLQDHISIERQDLLELELIADDFQGADDIEEDYEFDFEDEFEDDESEEDQGAFFRDNKMNNMLWDQINKLRNNSEVKEFEDTQDKKSGKRVKFAENLDIFEIEKIKYEEPGKKSKFKSRMESSKDRIDEPISDIIENTINEITEDPVNNVTENPINDVVEKPVNDIVEKTINDIVENAVDEVMKSEKPKRVSKFKQRAHKQVGIETPIKSKASTGISGGLSEEAVQAPINDIVEKEFNDYGNQATNNIINDSIQEVDAVSQNNELLEMMRKYNEEIDDIEGPVIQEVKDIEKYNKLQDKLDVDKYELHDHEHDHEHDADTEDDGKIMTEITEKETTVGDVEDLKDNLDSDVKREYFKLKDKLNESKEFEIEKPKISRFKQRLGN